MQDTQKEITDLEQRTSVRLLVAFVDITRFTARAVQTPPELLAQTVDEYYHRVHAVLEPAGGRVIKFIGDEVLAAFPIAAADAGVIALLELKSGLEAWFRELGWDSKAIVKVHAGDVIAGPFGPEGRFDIIGREVNIAATLVTRSFALSAEAFRSLAPETRKRFKKHTPPVTYIRAEDPHPHRTGRAV